MIGYTTSFTVDRSPREAYEAVLDVRGWWSEDATGVFDRAGGEFVHRYQDVHRCRMRITELVPDRRVVWHVVENHFGFVRDQSEWTGTDVVFEITEMAGGARVDFTHVGLTPADECYDVCSNAWAGYLGGSLRSLIETGAGQPNPAAGGDAPAHQDAAQAARVSTR